MRPNKNPEQRAMLEGLARRLNESFGQYLIFKGGLFLWAHTKFPRYTQDVDASIVDLSMYEWMKPVLKQFGEDMKALGKIASYEVVPDVLPTRSGGAKYKDANGSTVCSIDISLCNPVLDNAIVFLPNYGNIRISTVEQVVADKLSVQFSKKRFRRTKDIYDLYIIIKACPELDLARVKRIMAEKGTYPFNMEQMPFTQERMRELEKAYDKLDIYNAGYDKVSKPSFKEVIEAVGRLVATVDAV